MSRENERFVSLFVSITRFEWVRDPVLPHFEHESIALSNLHQKPKQMKKNMPTRQGAFSPLPLQICMDCVHSAAYS